MNNDELAYWRSKGLNFNPGAPPPRPTVVRVCPFPVPLVLSEPQHDGERLVYESFLISAPDMPGFAAYSMPLPHTDNRRIEADFVAVMPNGVALIEVKGGIVGVNSRPGPGVRWSHWTRSGKPTGRSVSPSQLYRVTETFLDKAQTKAGVDFGSRIAQLMVFPHTSRAQIDPAVLARLDALDRDFLRIVFAEELAAYGMWRLVADELARPGRDFVLVGDEASRLIGWIKGELDVQPGISILHQEVEEIANPRPKPLSFSKAPPIEEQRPYQGPPNRLSHLKDFLGRIKPPTPPPQPKPRNWISKLGFVLAILIVGGLWAGRSGQAPPTSALPPTSQVAVSTPAHQMPTIDPFQAALSKAVGEPEKRVAAGDKDWVRALGPVTGRPGCQFAEMSYSGKTYNVVACRDGDRGVWRY